MATLEKVNYHLHSIESAPEDAKPLLEASQKKLGFVPNMYGNMANVPSLLDTYLHGYQLFRSKGSFNATEQEIIFITISYIHECHYCVAAHSTIGDMTKVSGEIIEALRKGEKLADAKLDTLRAFTKVMVEKRGFPSDEEVTAFLDAGYTQNQILEIVLAISVKTISNYSNHIMDTPVDQAFAHRKWEK